AADIQAAVQWCLQTHFQSAHPNLTYVLHLAFVCYGTVSGTVQVNRLDFVFDIIVKHGSFCSCTSPGTALIANFVIDCLFLPEFWILDKSTESQGIAILKHRKPGILCDGGIQTCCRCQVVKQPDLRIVSTLLVRLGKIPACFIYLVCT